MAQIKTSGSSDNLTPLSTASSKPKPQDKKRSDQQAKAKAAPASHRAVTLRAGPTRSSSSSRSSQKGNAIYHISPDGFVREIFRESVMILRIVEIDQHLIVSTGNEGQLYRLQPETEEVSVLAHLEANQVPALFVTKQHQLIVGTSNPGTLLQLANRYTKEGTLTSPVLDANQISLWGRFQATITPKPNTHVLLQTRSGNTGNPDDGFWSPWSDATTIKLNGNQSAYLPINSPTARFLQYRLTLHSNGEHTPSIDRVSIKYLMPNLKPVIESIKTTLQSTARSSAPDQPVAQNKLKIEWRAKDANRDQLTYQLEARPYNSQAPFVTIAEKLKQPSFEWDTRTTPDGRYELRLTASDALSNIPSQTLAATRLSDPITIDNTPPSIDQFTLQPVDVQTYRLTAQLRDQLTPITRVAYSIDSQKEWRFMLPTDFIFDATDEAIDVTISNLAPGPHTITLRVYDAQNNMTLQSKMIHVNTQKNARP